MKMTKYICKLYDIDCFTFNQKYFDILYARFYNENKLPKKLLTK